MAQQAGDVLADGLSSDRRAELSTGHATRRLGAALGLVGLVLLVNGLVGCAAEPNRARPHRSRRAIRGTPTSWRRRSGWARCSTRTPRTAARWSRPTTRVVRALRRLRRDRGGRRVPTERRTADNGYFPAAMTPKQNPFYLDLPFDDMNDPAAFAHGARSFRGPTTRPVRRDGEPKRDLHEEPVGEDQRGDRICYGQIQDAGPGEYDDAEYVFGSEDAPEEQPVQRRRDGRLPGPQRLPGVRGPGRGGRSGGLAVRRRRRRAGGSLADPRDDGRVTP